MAAPGMQMTEKRAKSGSTEVSSVVGVEYLQQISSVVGSSSIEMPPAPSTPCSDQYPVKYTKYPTVRWLHSPCLLAIIPTTSHKKRKRPEPAAKSQHRTCLPRTTHQVDVAQNGIVQRLWQAALRRNALVRAAHKHVSLIILRVNHVNV
jgi:hypothetical protein